ncbi:MAG: PTS sugar transporter subunit IIA [Gammaproteobacteria bacterium]|nr:PTS sugar transporter subunit IIA [Gammaproteobacteria bacterium]MCF6259783.1 PTS sugar transporter subunit IIA [Gammaproteobacteria bacterium]
MQFSDIITPERIATQVPVASKKRALETLSDLFVKCSPDTLDAHDIFNSLIARERLGTTAIDHGVAIPHGRLKNSAETIGAFVQLADGIDCDAFDRQSVNLMFALLVPENSTEEHLQLLARLAEMFSDNELCEKLRAAANSQSLYDCLIDWDHSH